MIAPNDKSYVFKVVRQDNAFITVQAASAEDAETLIWEMLEDDYDTINELAWYGDHEVRKLPGEDYTDPTPL